MKNIRIDNETIINLDNIETIYHVGSKYTFDYVSGKQYTVFEEDLPILTKKYLDIFYLGQGGV